jgi:cyclic lactone autoinducer peptide
MKGVKTMPKRKIGEFAMKKAVTVALKGNANSTTCGTIFQPKAPASLKKFNKINNDK